MYIKSKYELIYECDYKAKRGSSHFKRRLSFFLSLKAPEAEFLFPKLAGPPNKLYF